MAAWQPPTGTARSCNQAKPGEAQPHQGVALVSGGSPTSRSLRQGRGCNPDQQRVALAQLQNALTRRQLAASNAPSAQVQHAGAGLRATVAEEQLLTIVGEARNGPDAVSLISSARPDLAIAGGA